MAKEKNSRDDAALYVILCIRGGVADVIHKPSGLAISIFDYDVDGKDSAVTDPDGDPCAIIEWPAGQEVVGNRRWPIIRKALRAAKQPYSWQWKCPSCKKIIRHTYEALVDVGTPICGDCDMDMEIVED